MGLAYTFQYHSLFSLWSSRKDGTAGTLAHGLSEIGVGYSHFERNKHESLVAQLRKLWLPQYVIFFFKVLVMFKVKNWTIF